MSAVNEHSSPLPLQSGHVEQLSRSAAAAAAAMTSQPAQVPVSPAGSVITGSGSCHALRASMPVVRSPNHSADCPLGTSSTSNNCDVIRTV